MTKLWRDIECNWMMRSLVAILVGFIIGGIGNEAFNRVVSDPKPPVVFKQTEALNSHVPIGGVLEVRITRDKRRTDCPTVKSDRYATDQDGKVFKLPSMIWPGGDPDTDYLDYGYDVSALPVGQYTLYVDLTYYCDGGARVFPITQPSVSFRIVPLGEEDHSLKLSQ